MKSHTSVAFGTVDLAHILFEFFANDLAGGFSVAALQVVDNAFKRRVVRATAVFAGVGHFDFLAVRAVEDGVQRLFGQFFDGRVEREAVVGGEPVVVHFGNGAAVAVAPAACLNGAIADG